MSIVTLWSVFPNPITFREKITPIQCSQLSTPTRWSSAQLPMLSIDHKLSGDHVQPYSYPLNPVPLTPKCTTHTAEGLLLMFSPLNSSIPLHQKVNSCLAVGLISNFSNQECLTTTYVFNRVYKLHVNSLEAEPNAIGVEIILPVIHAIRLGEAL